MAETFSVQHNKVHKGSMALSEQVGNTNDVEPEKKNELWRHWPTPHRGGQHDQGSAAERQVALEELQSFVQHARCSFASKLHTTVTQSHRRKGDSLLGVALYVKNNRYICNIGSEKYSSQCSGWNKSALCYTTVSWCVSTCGHNFHVSCFMF